MNAYIITFDEIEASNRYSHINGKRLSSLNEVIHTLDMLNYIDCGNVIGKRQHAFNCLEYYTPIRENADKYIYYLCNGYSDPKDYIYNSYVIQKVKNGEYTAYSEINSNNILYEYNLYHDRATIPIKENNDLLLKIENTTPAILIEHFKGKQSPERPVYDIFLPTKWKKIVLNDKLSPDNGVDTDGDSLTDWDEVDTIRLIWRADGSFSLPEIKLSYILRDVSRFNSPEFQALLSNGKTIHYLPIISDPSMIDSDGDLIDDEEEYLLGYNPISNDTDSDSLLDGEEMALGFDPLDSNPDNDDFDDAEELRTGRDPYVYEYEKKAWDHLGAISYGAIMGDFAEDELIDTEVLIAQIGGSFVPIAADVRDTIANAIHGDWAMAGLSLIGLAPIAGDAIKAVGNLGHAVVKIGDDVPTITKVIIGVAEKNPKLIKYFSKSDEVADAIKKSVKSDSVTREALEKMVKYADEAGIAISKSSDLLKNGDNVVEGIKGVWKNGPLKRGELIDEFLNAHSIGDGLGKNFPIVDRLENGVLVSTKSLDLGAKSYKNPEKLEKRLQKYIDQMNDFEKKYPKVKEPNGMKWGETELKSTQYTSKKLELIIPDMPMTTEQAQIIQEFIDKHKISVIIMKG